MSTTNPTVVVPAQPAAPALKRLSEVETSGEEKRFSTGVGGLDACLSESEDAPVGVPLGTSILISGMPGAGKSTIVTFMSAMNIQDDPNGQKADALYLHGEERAERVRKRWDRLGLKGADPYLFPLRDVEGALEVIRDLQAVSPRLVVVVDSVQSLTLGGKRRPEHQSEAAEMICGQVVSGGGLVILVNHVDKTGTSHAGSGELPHNVDIHIHVTINAKKAERFLEVRKNRCGRAGFQVPLNIGISSLTVGTPAPLSGQGGGMGGARSALEKACAIAVTMLMDGKFLTGYDFDDATIEAGYPINAGMWRAGLNMAAKQLERDGFVMLEEKKPGTTRKGWRMETPPPKAEPEVVADVPPAINPQAEADVKAQPGEPTLLELS